MGHETLLTILFVATDDRPPHWNNYSSCLSRDAFDEEAQSVYQIPTAILPQLDRIEMWGIDTNGTHNERQFCVIRALSDNGTLMYQGRMDASRNVLFSAGYCETCGAAVNGETFCDCEVATNEDNEYRCKECGNGFLFDGECQNWQCLSHHEEDDDEEQ